MAAFHPSGGRPPGPLRYAGFGIQLAASVVLFVLLGTWVDRRAGTGGLFAILGALVAFAASLYALLRDLKRHSDGDGR